jgi:hypothetical protein
MPGSPGPEYQRLHAPLVLVHAKVDKVPAYSTDQRFVLQGNRPVPLAAAKVVGISDCLRKASLAGLAGHMPARSPAIPAPIHRESKEVEVARTLSALLI